VGVRGGQHAVYIIKLNIKRLYLVDPYQLSYSANANAWYKAAHDLTFPHFRKVTWLLMSSEEAARIINDKFDFIYIDGNHKYEAVKKDLEIWYPKIRIGGVLCGHDYDPALAVPQVSEVHKVVDEFCAAKKLKLNTDYANKVNPHKGSDWYVIKK